MLRIFVGLIALSNGLAKLFSFPRSTSGRTSGRWSTGPRHVASSRRRPAARTGVLLLLGLLSRGAALIVFLQHFGLQLLYFSSGRFAFEQPHEWIPPLILAVVPAGLVWGLDGRLQRNRPRVRWPS